MQQRVCRWPVGVGAAVLLLAACGSDDASDSDAVTPTTEVASTTSTTAVPADAPATEPAPDDTTSSETPPSDSTPPDTATPDTATPDTATPDDQASESGDPDGACWFEYVIGGTPFGGQEGDVITWSESAESVSRLLVGDPSGDGYGAQLTFTTTSGLRPDGEPVSGVGDYFIRFADFKLTRDVMLGASTTNTGEGEITRYEPGAAVAGSGSGTVVDLDSGDRPDFTIEFSVFDSARDFGPDVFGCFIES